MNYNIYIIKSKLNNQKVYVGSTKKNINERLKQHINQYNQYKNNKHIYISSFDVIEYGEPYIELLEIVSHEKRSERESHYIRLLKSVNVATNIHIIRTPQEKKEYNKKYCLEYSKNNIECCPICNIRYSKNNRYNHRKSNKHFNQFHQKMINKLNELDLLIEVY
jgi:hypothetical protein